MGEIVVLKHVSKAFGENHVLTDINLKIPKGCIYGLLGHNGSGKTTTFRLIQGLYAANKGEVEVFGENPIKMAERQRCRIGVLGEDIGLYEGMTIKENIMFFGHLYNMDKREIEWQLNAYSELFDIRDQLNQVIGKLSTGMKKKIAVLKAIIHKPELLILDEPLNGLDPIMAEKLCQLIKHFKDTEHMTILLNSHHLDEIESIVDDYSIIKQGKNVALKSKTSSKLRYVIHTQNPLHGNMNDIEKYRVGEKHTDDISVEVEDIVELNQIIQHLINQKIYIEEVRPIKQSLKEVYLKYDAK